MGLLRSAGGVMEMGVPDLVSKPSVIRQRLSLGWFACDLKLCRFLLCVCLNYAMRLWGYVWETPKVWGDALCM